MGKCIDNVTNLNINLPIDQIGKTILYMKINRKEIDM